MVRVDLERCGIGFPCVTNALEGRFPLQCFEMFGEVVGGDEAEHVSLEAFEVVVVEGFDGSILHGAVHSLGLAIGPRMIRLRQAGLDAMLKANAIEDVRSEEASGWGSVHGRGGIWEPVRV